jgi:hypothetical protein
MSETYNISGGNHTWGGDGKLWTPQTTTTATDSATTQPFLTVSTPLTDADRLAERVAEAIGRQFELTEKIRSGSMGGKDPEARQKPVRTLVRTFGKWANGRFSKCVRILSKKPHLVAAGGGNVNRLCAWLKDQWLGSTKWRGNRARDLAMIKAKKAATAAEAQQMIDEGILVLPDWFPDDTETFLRELTELFEGELEREAREGYDPGMERDEPNSVLDNIVWDDDDDLDGDPASPDDDDDLEAFEGSLECPEYDYAKLLREEAEAMKGCDCEGEAAEALSLERQQKLLRAAIHEKYEKKRRDRGLEDAAEPSMSRGYTYVKETFPDYVIFEYTAYGEGECILYRQDYSLSEQGEVTLNGNPVRVEVDYKQVPETREWDAGGNTATEPAQADPTQANSAPGSTASDASDDTDKDDSTDTKEPEAEGNEPASDSERTKPTAAAPSGFSWVVVKSGDRSMPALVQDKTGRIVRGPRLILGKKLPPVPRTVTEAASDKTAKAAAVGGNSAAATDFGKCLSAQMKKGLNFVEARRACTKARQEGKTEEGAVEVYAARLSAEERKRSAVIVRTKANGTKEYKFPIPDVSHARLALAMINQSDLTEEEKKKVRRRALAVLGKKGSNAKEDEGTPTPETSEASQGGPSEAPSDAGVDVDVVSVAEGEVLIDEIVPSDNIVAIAESKTSPSKPTTPSGKEVDAIVRVIVPGPGNPADNFYYPRDVIRRDIKLLAEGKKMYKDHLSPQQEKLLGGRTRSVDDWAAVIEEAWTNEDGRGFGGVTFVDEAFHQKAKKGHRHLGVSIRARAVAKPGMVDGKNYRVVESFIQGRSVDFVTEAGAGGGFESVAEAHREETMAKFEGTLDDLMQDRPDLLDAFRAQVEAQTIEALADAGAAGEGEGEGKETTESGTTQSETYTKEELVQMIQEAREAAVSEVKEMQKVEDQKARQRAVLDAMLTSSGLKTASVASIKSELHDAVYEDVTEGGKVTLTGEEVFKQKAQEIIEAKKQEISEYISGIVRVRGLGPGSASGTGETSEGETDGGASTKKSPVAWDANAEIDRLTAEPSSPFATKDTSSAAA